MSDPGLENIFNRLSQSLAEDKLIQSTTDDLRKQLMVDRIALYYFYRQWSGRVTFESLSSDNYSILGSTGPDDCFNGEYAALYLNGRIRAIADVETAQIAECHREFLKGIQVKANLVVPVLTSKGLWGLLVAHHCQSPVDWSQQQVEAMWQGSKTLALSPTISDNRASDRAF